LKAFELVRRSLQRNMAYQGRFESGYNCSQECVFENKTVEFDVRKSPLNLKRISAEVYLNSLNKSKVDSSFVTASASLPIIDDLKTKAAACKSL
jgi:hypothetical protein